MARLAPRPGPTDETALLFRLLADETRLAIIRLLAITDLRAGELCDRLALPANAVSYHLKQLRELGVLRDRRSHADARDIYYSLDAGRLRQLHERAGRDLVPGLASGDPDATADTTALRVLFLCTHNSARSQLAEAILRHLGGDRVQACSAGSQPSAVHPTALGLLEAHGIETAGLASKAIDPFLDREFDYVITVCDRIREHCPTFPGDPAALHWSLPDPAAGEDPAAREQAFALVWLTLQLRIRQLLALPHPRTGRPVAATGRGRDAGA